MQVGHFLRVVLLRFQPPQVKPVGTENDVHHRQSQDGGLPSEGVIADADQDRKRAARQVIRERPDVAFAPDPGKVLGFRQRHHPRDQYRASQEVCRGGGGHADEHLSQARHRVVGAESKGNRDRGARQFERNAERLRVVPVAPQGLNEHRQARQQHGFRIAEIQHAQHNENVAYRDGSGDAGQKHLESRRG